MECVELAINALLKKSEFEPGPARIQREKEREKNKQNGHRRTFILINLTKSSVYIMRNELDEQKNKQSICPEFTM